MRISLASLLTTAALAVTLAACGDNVEGDDDTAVDAPRIDAPIDAADIDAADIDAAVDARIDAAIDATPIDAPIDAPPTNSELIGFARAAADGTGLTLPIIDATITYIKPAIGTDPAGFTIQVEQTGPGLMVAVNPAGLTPTPTVGDVVSFTITEKVTVADQPRAAAITGYTRTTAGTDINPLVQDVSAATDLVTMIANYESEVIDVTGTITGTVGSSGSGFERFGINTAGITVADSNFQLRLPATLRDALDVTTGCGFSLNNTPVGRFTSGANSQTQLAAFVAADITLTGCPAPIVVAATALSATSVQVTFSRNVLASSVMTDGSQFTFDNGLTASAAAVSGRTVTVTTSTQTAGTMYVATVGAGVTDTAGTALGTPNFTTFAGFIDPMPTHLLITEIKTTDTNEFVEIYNPTSATVDLRNYYLTDHQSYFLLPGVVAGNTVQPSTDASDFLARFPVGATIAPGAVITVAMDAVTFETSFASVPTYTVQELGNSVAMELIWASGSPNPGLTNAGELAALFFWDGATDTVKDVDIIVAGFDVSAANDLIAKTAVDGPDVDADTTAYASDAMTIQDMETDTPNGTSYKRILFETGHEIQTTTGNGLTGDDETSEQCRTTWDSQATGSNYTAGTPGTVPASLNL